MNETLVLKKQLQELRQRTMFLPGCEKSGIVQFNPKLFEESDFAVSEHRLEMTVDISKVKIS